MSIQTDARGYRVLPGYKIPKFKSKGIVGVGDSIMFGLGVDGEETSLARFSDPMSDSNNQSWRIRIQHEAIMAFFLNLKKLHNIIHGKLFFPTVLIILS